MSKYMIKYNQSYDNKFMINNWLTNKCTTIQSFAI